MTFSSRVGTSRVALSALSAVLLTMCLATQAAEPRSSASKHAAPLDLRPPLITKIFTPQQIDMILASAVAPELEHIEVEASRVNDLPLKDNSASTPEAVFHEVVRWLAPRPTVLAAQVNAAPDVTNSYRPVPIAMWAYDESFGVPYSQR